MILFESDIIGLNKLVNSQWNAHPVDMFPTILNLAGIPIPKNNKPVDRKSLKPLLKGRVNNWQDRLIFNSKDQPYYFSITKS